MKESLDDYNRMFGTTYGIGEIKGYNANLNDRLARKKSKFKSRDEQLDLVIVVNRLLTGFDAPCLSTVFMDRQPMHPHDIIQAFSRTNRLFDKPKQAGQIVTFQSPHKFKRAVDEALILYSAGGEASVRHGLPERRGVCGRLYRRRPQVSAHQCQRRCGPLRVHSLL